MNQIGSETGFIRSDGRHSSTGAAQVAPRHREDSVIHSISSVQRIGHTRAGFGLLAVSMALLSFLAFATPAAADPGNGRGGPAGNNGTIKIDGNDFDTHPNNQPHVDCTFQVDFYGYDAGDLWASLTFEVHPPTGNAVVLTDSVWIGEDGNGAGGSEGGLDAEAGNQDLDGVRFYDLTSVLAGYEPHPTQGYHVKLTVNADGSQGADRKHKVFWVAPCEVPVVSEPPTTVSSPTPRGGTNPPTGGLNPSTSRPSSRASSIPNTATDADSSGLDLATVLSIALLIGSLGWLGAAQLNRSRSAQR